MIQENLKGYPTRVAKIRKAELYYAGENDILRKRNPLEKKQTEKNNPLREADARISHAWHQLLLNQKASYTMTNPPTFDVKDEELNHKLVVLLGDRFPKIAKDLTVNAGNAGVAWVHVWRDSDNDFFRYSVVDSKQIIPIFSKSLDHKLEGVLRTYEDYNDKGQKVLIYEYWNDTTCQTFSTLKKDGLEGLTEFDSFEIMNEINGQIDKSSTNTFEHNWEDVPFIPFKNNPLEQSDLDVVKQLIDTYDKVFSGFVNDVDDVQQVIFVLTNYGGEDKQEFLQNLKQYKMIKVDDDDETQSKVDTLAIDIPVEARSRLLEMTREAIFTQGQGVDPQKNISQNNSGVALAYMYSLLELKASMLETEFRVGFATLIRFMLKYLNVDSDIIVEQKWTRSSINDDARQATIVSQLASFTSNKAIAKSNPLVENWEEELQELEQEKLNVYRAEDDYKN